MEEKHFGKGNDGKSTLSSQFKISKSDPRFSAIGTLDELAAEVYLCLAANSDIGYGAGFNVDCDAASDSDFEAAMREILGAIGKISDGMAYPRDSHYAVTENELSRVSGLMSNPQSLRTNLLRGSISQERSPEEPSAKSLRRTLNSARPKTRRLISTGFRLFSPRRSNAPTRSQKERAA